MTRYRNTIRQQWIYIVFCGFLLAILAVSYLNKHYTVSLQFDSDVPLQKMETEVDYQTFPKSNPESVILPERRIKVILFTYMRGGSTFLGQLFNQHPDTFYIFEPVTAVYKELYGVPLRNWQPLDIYFNGPKSRFIPEHEKAAIQKMVTSIFQCNTSALLTELLLSKFLFAFDQTWIHQAYGPCLLKKFGDHIGKTLENGEQYFGHRLDGCRALLPCPSFPFSEDMARCRLDLITAYSELGKDETLMGSRMFPYIYYHNCMQTARDRGKPCYPFFEQECKKSSIIAIKVIRLHMAVVERLLKNDPDIKIIYYMRDPRAMVASRDTINFLSLASGNDTLEEATILCKRIKSDLNIMERLEQSYPHTFQRILYEDLVLDPEAAITSIFQHLGLKETPPEVSAWLEKSMHARPEDKKEGNYKGFAKMYGTYKEDARSTATNWRTKFESSRLDDLTYTCMDVLNKFNYEI